MGELNFNLLKVEISGDYTCNTNKIIELHVSKTALLLGRLTSFPLQEKLTGGPYIPVPKNLHL